MVALRFDLNWDDERGEFVVEMNGKSLYVFKMMVKWNSKAKDDRDWNLMEILIFAFLKRMSANFGSFDLLGKL